MNNPVTLEFKTISSDDTLFDFEMMINKIRKAKQISDKDFMEKVRVYFFNKYPDMTSIEQAVAVASFMVREMSYKKFTETLDILQAETTIQITL